MAGICRVACRTHWSTSFGAVLAGRVPPGASLTVGYTARIWINHVQADFPDLTLQVLATDADETMLQRAERASYPASSLKQLPADWKQKAFTPNNGEYQLAPQFRSLVRFQKADIRVDTPAELFSLILCRNLVFTYFDEPLQRQVLARLSERLQPGGYLVIGKHESLPAAKAGLVPAPVRLGFLRRA